MATVYTTWNPSDKDPDVNLSGGNLIVQVTSSQNGQVRSIRSVSSGKWYWEITVTSLGGLGSLGIANSSAVLTLAYLGSDANGWAYLWNGNKYNNATQTAYGLTYQVEGYVLSIALDMDNGELYFARNGTWQNSSNPVTRVNPAFTGLTGDIFAAIGINSASGWTFTANFGASSFGYSVPSGYNSGLYTVEIEAAISESFTMDDAGDDIAINTITENFSFDDVEEEIAINTISENFTMDDAGTEAINMMAYIQEDFTIDDAEDVQTTYNVSSAEDFTIDDAQSVLWEGYPTISEDFTMDEAIDTNWIALCELDESFSIDDQHEPGMGTEVRRLRLFWNKRTQHLAIKFENANASQRLYLEQLGLLLFGEPAITESRYLFNYRTQHLALRFRNNTIDESLYLKNLGLSLYQEKPVNQNRYLFNLKGKHISLMFQNNTIDESLYLKDVGLELYEHLNQ